MPGEIVLKPSRGWRGRKRTADVEPEETALDDADDGERPAVERDRLTEYVAAAIGALPEFVLEHHDVGAWSRPIVVRA
jgi:hypothetical protein